MVPDKPCCFIYWLKDVSKPVFLLPFSEFISGIFPLPRFESGTRFAFLSFLSSSQPSHSLLSLFFCTPFPLSSFLVCLSFPSSLSSSQCTFTFSSPTCSSLLPASSSPRISPSSRLRLLQGHKWWVNTNDELSLRCFRKFYRIQHMLSRIN